MHWRKTYNPFYGFVCSFFLENLFFFYKTVSDRFCWHLDSEVFCMPFGGLPRPNFSPDLPILVQPVGPILEFSLFSDTVSITSISPSRGPTEGNPDPKNQLYVNFNNFSTKRTTLDLKVPLNRACRLLKFCFRKHSPEVTPRTLEPIFFKFTSF